MLGLSDAGWENEYDFIFTAVATQTLSASPDFLFFFPGGIFTGMPWKDLQTFWPG